MAKATKQDVAIDEKTRDKITQIKSPKAKTEKVIKDDNKPSRAEAPNNNDDESAVEKKLSTKKKDSQDTSVSTAKAGKRSAKSLKETEQKKEKEDRKKETGAKGEEPRKQKTAQKVRSKLERRSKNYRKSAEKIEKGKFYSLRDGLELATKTSTVKFDASLELHARLGVDPKQADQNVRDTVVLPGGTGKSVRVAVYVSPDDITKAKQAGADIASSDEFLEQLEKGRINFDVLIVTPALMPKLGKYARVLGPKGLMPNPKSGTVTADVAKAVKEAKSGRVEYRVDSTGIVHVAIGKVSFGTDKLLENAKAILTNIKSNKPASLKGTYILSVYMATTMGPSIPIELSDVNSL